MSELREFAAGLLVLAGCAFCVVGALGLVRLRGFYLRTHAASVIDSAGALLVLAGLALHAGLALVTAKLAILALLVFFTSPTATHALANAALARGLHPQAEAGEALSKR